MSRHAIIVREFNLKIITPPSSENNISIPCNRKQRPVHVGERNSLTRNVKHIKPRLTKFNSPTTTPQPHGRIRPKARHHFMSRKKRETNPSRTIFQQEVRFTNKPTSYRLHTPHTNDQTRVQGTISSKDLWKRPGNNLTSFV